MTPGYRCAERDAWNPLLFEQDYSIVKVWRLILEQSFFAIEVSLFCGMIVLDMPMSLSQFTVSKINQPSIKDAADDQNRTSLCFFWYLVEETGLNVNSHFARNSMKIAVMHIPKVEISIVPCSTV